MTLGDIFAKITQHQIKGLMIHSQLAEYYGFLGLSGYSKCHEHHYYAESCNYMKLIGYYLCHCNKLIETLPVENPKVIPDSWYKYSRQDVDVNTKQTAVKNGVEMWVNWEKETKKLYEELYTELVNIGEIAPSIKIKCLIEDVDKELKEATQHHLNLKLVDYDTTYIAGEQSLLYAKYKKKGV